MRFERPGEDSAIQEVNERPADVSIDDPELRPGDDVAIQEVNERPADVSIDDPELRPGDDVAIQEVNERPPDVSIDDPNIRPGDDVAFHDVNERPADERMIHDVDNGPVAAPTPGGFPLLPIAVGIGAAVVIAVAAFSFLGAGEGGPTASPSGPTAVAGSASATINLDGTQHVLSGGICFRKESGTGPSGDGTFDTWGVSIPGDDFLIMALYWPGTADDGNFQDAVAPEQSISFKLGDVQANVRPVDAFVYGPIVTAGTYAGPRTVAFDGTYLVDRPIEVAITCVGPN